MSTYRIRLMAWAFTCAAAIMGDGILAVLLGPPVFLLINALIIFAIFTVCAIGFHILLDEQRKKDAANEAQLIREQEAEERRRITADRQAIEREQLRVSSELAMMEPPHSFSRGVNIRMNPAWDVTQAKQRAYHQSVYEAVQSGYPIPAHTVSDREFWENRWLDKPPTQEELVYYAKLMQEGRKP